MNSRQARIETATRLQFSENSISKIVREKIATGTVSDNSKIRIQKNAFEKLAEEEVETLRKLVSVLPYFSQLSSNFSSKRCFHETFAKKV